MSDWVLAPRDGFFAKDGRGWFTSASGRAHGLDWPWPSTIRGALRSAYGYALEAAGRGEVAGALSKQQWLEDTAAVRLGATLPVCGTPGAYTPADRRWPVPADAWYAAADEQGGARVTPLSPAPPRAHVHVRRFGADADAAATLWRPRVPPGKPAPRPRWWTDAELGAWLRGEPVATHDEAARRARALTTRTEVRLRIDPASHTAADGFLFSTEITETDTADGRRWAVAAQVEWPAALTPDALAGAVTVLGGKRRMARLEAADGLFAPLDDSGAPSPGLRIYLVTPAHFTRGWLPDGFELRGDALVGCLPGVEGDVVLRGALVDRPAALAGWDMQAHRPKPIRRLAPAGSTYFVQRADARPFTAADRAALWLATLQDDTKLDDIADGLGRVVAAPWTTDTEEPR